MTHDEFVDVKIEIIQQMELSYFGPTVILKTRRGDEYRVWFGPDGPLIQRIVR